MPGSIYEVLTGTRIEHLKHTKDRPVSCVLMQHISMLQKSTETGTGELLGSYLMILNDISKCI